jgi:hypothetical protein
MRLRGSTNEVNLTRSQEYGFGFLKVRGSIDVQPSTFYAYNSRKPGSQQFVIEGVDLGLTFTRRLIAAESLPYPWPVQE